MSADFCQLCGAGSLLFCLDIVYYRVKNEDFYFDCTYVMNCLLYVLNSEIDRVLSELKRVVKKGGRIFICQYGNKHCDDEGLKDNKDKGERFFLSGLMKHFWV